MDSSSEKPVVVSPMITPRKPRIRPLVPFSLISPSDPLPKPLSPLFSGTRITSFNQRLFSVKTDKDTSLSVDDLSFETISLDSDLHIGSLTIDVEGSDSPPLRTPFHPSSPLLLSPETPLHLDLSAFPMFDAKVGPNANTLSRSIFSSTRPKLRHESSMISLDSSADDSGDILLSPSFPQRKIFSLRRSSSWRPLKTAKKNLGQELSSIPEALSQTLPLEQPPSSRFITRKDKPTIFIDEEDEQLKFTCDSSSTYLHPGPYDSNDRKHAHAKLSKRFIGNLPPFKLPSPSLAPSPITISPLTPSRCPTPLRSPFLIRRKDEVGLKGEAESNGYFSSVM